MRQVVGQLTRRLRQLESVVGRTSSAGKLASAAAALVEPYVFPSAPRIYSALAGANSGLNFESVGRDVGSVLRVVGTMALAPVASGAAQGIAGAGTSSTSLAKPTGAANWTAGTMFGYLVEVIGGGGASTDGRPVFGVIVGNTTTTATLSQAIPGLDASTIFRIVVPASAFDWASPAVATCLRVAGSVVPVEIYGVGFNSAHTLDSLVSLSGCPRVTMAGCFFNLNTAGPSAFIEDCSRVEVKNCLFGSGADLSIRDCRVATVSGCVSGGGGPVEVVDCLRASVTKHFAVSAPSRVLSMVRVLTAEAEVNATGGGATPVYLESVSDFTAVGTLLTGTGNTGWGVEMARAGRYTLTGCTITGGSGDAKFMGQTVSWALLSSPSYGIAEEYAGSAIANAAYSMSIKYGNYNFVGDVKVGGRLQTFGYFNMAANAAAVPTLTGTQVLDCSDGTIDGSPGGFEAPRAFLEVICNSATARVKPPSGAAIAGCMWACYNRGSATLTLSAPTGGSVTGGSIPAGSGKIFFSLNGNGGKDWVAF